MTDIIKKAVELADGFEWDIERDAIVYTQYGQMNFAKDEPIFLDHLAAQLYRQYVVKVGHGFYRSPDPLVDITKIVETGALE